MSAAQSESFGVSWEEAYGYVQAVKRADTIYISGQFGHDGEEMVAPAPLDERGQVTDYGNMAEQMRQTYVNAQKVLERFGATLKDVVEEVLYVLDMESAFAAAGPVRKAAYGQETPQVASTILVTPRLALPAQLVEIKFVAKM